MNDYDCILNIRMIWFLNDTLRVNLDILFLYFKSNQNTCYLPCYYLFFVSIHLYCVCKHVCMWGGHMYMPVCRYDLLRCTCVTVRGQVAGVTSLLPVHGTETQVLSLPNHLTSHFYPIIPMRISHLLMF